MVQELDDMECCWLSNRQIKLNKCVQIINPTLKYMNPTVLTNMQFIH
jgi:hypothetical protein